jgi:hypothetical protein
VKNFPLIPIPPLPVKQVKGNLFLFSSSGNNLNFFVKEKITIRLMNSFNNCLGKPFVALKLKYVPIFFFPFCVELLSNMHCYFMFMSDLCFNFLSVLGSHRSSNLVAKNLSWEKSM